jgi:hypothetical protein
VKRFWAILCALFALSIATTADAVTYRLMIYIPAHGGLPATQPFNMGAKTLAGYGGCSSTGANNSYAFSNINYTGAFASSLVFVSTGTTTSADGVYFLDSHHCLVPAGTYGQAPTHTPVSGTYAITDNNGSTGNVVITAVANRWDLTNVDPLAQATGSISTTNGGTLTLTTNPGADLYVGEYVTAASNVSAGTQITSVTCGTCHQFSAGSAVVLVNNSQTTSSRTLTLGDGANPDLASCTTTCSTFTTQISTVMQKDPASGGPVMGDVIALRCGTVIGAPFWDRAVLSPTAFTWSTTPGDMRIVRPAYQALKDRISGADGQGGPYTAWTLPDASWIKVTSDTCTGTAPTAIIRHAQWNGGTQEQQGFWFTGLQGKWDYDGTHAWGQSTANFTFGTGGAVSQSYVKFTNNTFSSDAPSVGAGQRGTSGILSVAVVQGSTGCSTASITFFDNGAVPPRVQHGSGAAYHAMIAGGSITQWIQDSVGANYDNNVIAGGNTSTGQGTQAKVTSDCTGLAPTATPNVNQLNIPTGIFGNADTSGHGNTEFVIMNNVATDMWDFVNIKGNQTTLANASIPSDIWFVGNTCDRPWTACSQFSNASNVFTEWNFIKNIKYASGFFHPDCEIRLYQNVPSGATIPFGDVIGNICVRATGFGTDPNAWGDEQGFFMSNVNNSPTITGCKFEGNIYVGTYFNGVTLAACDSTALVAFNTLVWDPTTGIANLNQLGAAQVSTAPTVSRYSGTPSPTWSGGLSAYNAVAGANGVWSGGTPTSTCNVVSIGSGVGDGTYYASTPTWTALTTIALVQSTFQPKTGGKLTPAGTAQPTCNGGSAPAYNAGTGGYFDYVNRINTAPF